MLASITTYSILEPVSVETVTNYRRVGIDYSNILGKIVLKVVAFGILVLYAAVKFWRLNRQHPVTQYLTILKCRRFATSVHSLSLAASSSLSTQDTDSKVRAPGLFKMT